METAHARRLAQAAQARRLAKRAQWLKENEAKWARLLAANTIHPTYRGKGQ